MTAYSTELKEKIWQYIKRLPRDLGFPNKVDVEYEEHAHILNTSEFAIRDILQEFEDMGRIWLEKTNSGAFVNFR